MALLSWFSSGKGNVPGSSRWGLWWGRDSHTGETVTDQTALNLSTVWACARLISETIGTLPLKVYERQDDGSRVPVRDHPLYAVLHDRPNYDQTAGQFWEGQSVALALAGNSYSVITRNGLGDVVALEPVVPHNIAGRRDHDGVMKYRVMDAGTQTEFDESDIFHVRGWGTDRDFGLSTIAYARHTIGAALAGEREAGSMFKNGLRPSGFLTVDRLLTPEQRKAVKDGLVEPMTGADAAGKVGVLEADMTFQQVTLSPVDAQLLESRQFSIEEICRWFRVPPFMVGHTSNSTSWGTGLEQQLLAFLKFALAPYLTRIEQRINLHLIGPQDRGRIFVEFDARALLRADSQARAEFYSKMTQNGAMTRNEVRDAENLPRVDGGDGLTVQANLVPLDQLGEQAPNFTITGGSGS